MKKTSRIARRALRIDAPPPKSDARCAMRDARWLPFLFLAFTLPLSAQLTSDQVPHERTLPESEEIRQQLEDSRYSIGPIRVHPLFALRDLGYDSNVLGTADNPVSDWRATVSGGARFLLPMGRKMYVRGTVDPEYTWYRRLTTRRGWGGDYGGSILGLWNHLTAEGGGDINKIVAPVNSEVLASALGTTRNVFGRTELEILRRLSIYANVQSQQQRYDSSQDVTGSLQSLERNDAFASGGVRYRFRSFLDIALGVEKGRTRFLTGFDRNNDTSAVILGFHYDRPRTFMNVAIGSRKYEASGATNFFPAFSTPTGSYFIEHRLAAPVAIDVYGHRALQYSTTTSPYFIEQRSGVGVTIPIGSRFGVRAFGEAGRNSYRFPDAITKIKRADRVTTAGAGFLIRVYRQTAVITSISRDRYASNIPGYDRSLVRITSTLSLGGNSLQ